MLQKPSEDSINNFKEIRNQTRKMIRTCQRKADSDKLDEIKESYNMQKTRKFHKDVREVRGGFKPRSTTILKNDDGKLITGNKDILNAGKIYFKKLINTYEPEEESPYKYQQYNDDIQEAPTLEESVSDRKFEK